MNGLFRIKEIRQRDHQQERPAKGADRNPRTVHDLGVAVRMRPSELYRRPWPDLGRDTNDGQRENDPHSKDSDQNTPCQEPPLPNRGHLTQLVRVHDRIVEGERNFQNRQHSRDEQHVQHTCHGAKDAPPQNQTEDKTASGHSESQREIPQRRFRTRFCQFRPP